MEKNGVFAIENSMVVPQKNQTELLEDIEEFAKQEVQTLENFPKSHKNVSLLLESSEGLRKNFNKIWDNGSGILRGCSYKSCRILFIDKYPGYGQIEYILQFYENSRAQQPTINAIIITSALSKEGEDYLKSLKTPTPKVRLGESVVVVYL